MKINCIVFDWAGTTVDYGCFAPVAAFVRAFSDLGISLTAKEARGPMGMNKIDHIRELFCLDTISSKFKIIKSRDFAEEDVIEMNKNFEKYLFASLKDYTTPIDGVIEIVESLHSSGLKIGSTSGYTKAMMDIVAPEAATKGYSPDCWVTADGLPAGRPKPYMIYQNMINLGVESPRTIIKVGDTVADIKEGVTANVWSVGVILGSSEMGLSQDETNSLSEQDRLVKMEEVRVVMHDAGADYVIDSMQQLPQLITIINKRLENKQ